MLDCSAHRVEQCGAAAGNVVFRGHFGNFLDRYAVVEHLLLGVEEDGGEVSFAFFCALLLQHGVESSDCVALKP